MNRNETNAQLKKTKTREREIFYLTTHSTHFIYGYMASDIWLRTILIVRKETRCRHIGYSYRLTARVLLYAPSHRQDNKYHGLCYTSRGALAGTRNSSMGPPHEGSIRRPTAPLANALPLSYVLLLKNKKQTKNNPKTHQPPPPPQQQKQTTPKPPKTTTKGRNDALNTFYLWLYSVRHNMVKDHSNGERGNPIPPHGLLFPIRIKGSFICIIPWTG